MTSANHPPQPPTKRQDAPQVTGQAVRRSQPDGEVSRVPRPAMIQPLTGYLYPVGVARSPQRTNSEFGISINQFDEHRNRFVEVIERVRFLDADGVMTDRLIVIVCGVIVQIVAHDDSPRTVIVKIGEDVRMIPRAALIFIFLHLAKRSQA